MFCERTAFNIGYVELRSRADGRNLSEQLRVRVHCRWRVTPSRCSCLSSLVHTNWGPGHWNQPFLWHATKMRQERALGTMWNARTTSSSRNSDLVVFAQNKPARKKNFVDLDVARFLYSCCYWFFFLYLFVRARLCIYLCIWLMWTNGQNRGPTSKTQWFLLNEMCMVIHLPAYTGRDNLKQFFSKMDGRKKVPDWECLFVHRQQGLFLSVYVDDIKLAGRKHHMNPMWKQLMKHFDQVEATSFLDHVYWGCTQRECKPTDNMVDEHRKMFESRITVGATEKLLVLRFVTLFSLCVCLFFSVLSHAGRCPAAHRPSWEDGRWAVFLCHSRLFVCLAVNIPLAIIAGLRLCFSFFTSVVTVLPCVVLLHPPLLCMVTLSPSVVPPSLSSPRNIHSQFSMFE